MLIAYQNKHWPIPLQISNGWGTRAEIHAYLSSLCSSQLCDFMIIQDDLSPEHTICLTGCVLLPPSSQHELLQVLHPQNLLLWLPKGCCCQTECGGNVWAGRDECLYKQHSYRWEKLLLPAQPRKSEHTWHQHTCRGWAWRVAAVHSQQRVITFLVGPWQDLVMRKASTFVFALWNRHQGRQ